MEKREQKLQCQEGKGSNPGFQLLLLLELIGAKVLWNNVHLSAMIVVREN